MGVSVKKGKEMYLVTVKASRKKMMVFSTHLEGNFNNCNRKTDSLAFDMHHNFPNIHVHHVVSFQEEIEMHIKIYLSDLVLEWGK